MNQQRLIKIITRVLIGFGIVAVVGIVWLIVILHSIFENATQEVTDIKRYREIRQQFGSSALVKHFPDDIPVDAKDIRLYYLPGFLQGGTIFQLKMKLPVKKIKSLQSQYQPLAKRKYKQGDKNNSPRTSKCADINVNHEYRCYTCGNEVTSFPPAYEILVFEDTRGEPKCDWNHPEVYGVTINASTSEVTYWAEDW